MTHEIYSVNLKFTQLISEIYSVNLRFTQLISKFTQLISNLLSKESLLS